MRRALRALLPRVFFAVVGAGVLWFAPHVAGWPEWATVTLFGVAALGLVVVLGKLLYDTLFYDHRWP